MSPSPAGGSGGGAAPLPPVTKKKAARVELGHPSRRTGPIPFGSEPLVMGTASRRDLRRTMTTGSELRARLENHLVPYSANLTGLEP